MASTKLFAFVFFLACFYETSCAQYKDCGSAKGSTVSVEISGCGTLRRCPLTRKTNATMELTFTPSEDTNTLNAVVHGVILGVPMPFSLPNSDGCKDSGISCPLKAGQTYKYVTSLPISQDYPRVTVDIKWELQDSEENDVVCVQIPAKIV